MFERIVVPLDGSELAAKALPVAEELARLAKAPIHLIRVVDLTRLEQYGPYGLAIEYAGFEQVAEVERTVARKYLEGTAAEVTARGLTATTEVQDGATPRVLLGQSKTGDVIVMATHGRTGMSRWFLGSVAEDVVRQSAVPVMLVRAMPAGGKTDAAAHG